MFFNKKKESPITALRFDKTNINFAVDGMDYLQLIIQPTGAQPSIQYEYDSSIVAVSGDKNGAVVTGLKAGTTRLQVTAQDYKAVCIILVK